MNAPKPNLPRSDDAADAYRFRKMMDAAGQWYENSARAQLVGRLRELCDAEWSPPETQPNLLAPIDRLISKIIQDVAELDYNSPEDQPDVMLVTAGQLRGIIESNLEAYSRPVGEAVAWQRKTHASPDVWTPCSREEFDLWNKQKLPVFETRALFDRPVACDRNAVAWQWRYRRCSEAKWGDWAISDNKLDADDSVAGFRSDGYEVETRALSPQSEHGGNKPFDVLRNQLPPEVRSRAEVRTKEMLQDIDTPTPSREEKDLMPCLCVTGDQIHFCRHKNRCDQTAEPKAHVAGDGSALSTGSSQPVRTSEQPAIDAIRYRFLRDGNYPIEIVRRILNNTPRGIDEHVDALMANYSSADVPWLKSYIDTKSRPAVDFQYLNREEMLVNCPSEDNPTRTEVGPESHGSHEQTAGGSAGEE